MQREALQASFSTMPDAIRLDERPSTSSPTYQSRPRTRNGSMNGSKLCRSLSPTRVFANSNSSGTDQYRTVLPDLFRQKSGLQLLHSLYVQDLSQSGGNQESLRQPKLLSRLEGLLVDKLEALQKQGTTDKLSMTRLQADAHRQVFDAFLRSFTTYQHLLLKIREEYNKALEDSFSAIYDNILMRNTLGQQEHLKEEAVEDARQEGAVMARALRQETEMKIAEMVQLASEAETKATAAEAETTQIRAEMESNRRQLAALESENTSLRDSLLQSTTWAVLQYSKRGPPGNLLS